MKSDGGLPQACSSSSQMVNPNDRQTLRDLRLKALGELEEVSTIDEKVDTVTSRSPCPFDTSSVHNLLWDATFTTEADKKRWYNQGIHTSALVERKSDKQTLDSTGEEGNLAHKKWGLVQSQGGPCGVLAAIQAEMIRRLNFDFESGKEVNCTLTDIKECLALSLGTILARCALMDTVKDDDIVSTTESKTVRVVLPKNKERLSFEEMMDSTTDQMEAIMVKVDTTSSSRTKRAKNDQGSSHKSCSDDILQDLSLTIKEIFLENDATILSLLYREGGVLLFVMSLVGSRGVDRIRAGTSFCFSFAQK